MTARALQRVVVRMLYDPALADAVYAGEAALPELDEAERAWLVAPDRRRWAADPLRRTRGLHALLEEFPVSAAVAGVHRLDAFFSSAAFHRCVQEDRSLAAAFASWLAQIGPSVAALAELEGAAARVLRAQRVSVTVFARSGRWRTGGTVAPLVAPEGLLEAYEGVLGRLAGHREGVVAALLALPAPVEVGFGGGEEGLLVERGRDGAVVGGAARPLVDLLRAAEHGLSGEVLLTELLRLGADDDAEALELAREFVADGLLVPA